MFVYTKVSPRYSKKCENWGCSLLRSPHRFQRIFSLMFDTWSCTKHKFSFVVQKKTILQLKYLGYWVQFLSVWLRRLPLPWSYMNVIQSILFMNLWETFRVSKFLSSENITVSYTCWTIIYYNKHACFYACI